jgi:hypothetical protein
MNTSINLIDDINSLNNILEKTSQKFIEAEDKFHERVLNFEFSSRVSNLIDNKLELKYSSGGQSLGFTNGDSPEQTQSNKSILAGTKFPPKI